MQMYMWPVPVSSRLHDPASAQQQIYHHLHDPDDEGVDEGVAKQTAKFHTCSTARALMAMHAHLPAEIPSCWRLLMLGIVNLTDA
jgi:hypothetical protein